MADSDLTKVTTEEVPPTISTAFPGPGEFQNQVRTLMYIMSVVLIVSLLTNTFTIFVLRRSVFSEVESILYRLLAVEDMLTCSTSLALIRVFKDSYMISVYIAWYCVFPLLYQTIGIVLSINICRYVMIVKPLLFSKWITRRRIIFGHAVLFVVSFPLSHVIKVLGSRDGNVFSVYTTVPVLFGFGVQLITSIHIMHISMEQSRRIAAERNRFVRNHHGLGQGTPSPDNHQQHLRHNSFKGLRTVFVIIGSYWVGWLPMLLNFFSENGYFLLPGWFRVFSIFGTLLNFCWNPIIFYYTNRAFRTATNEMFRSVCCKS